jgi:prepilin-type N-terminal cleavage/methylation domain-containing protein
MRDNRGRKTDCFGGNKGFSLFELLTVLIILGVMAGVSVPAIGRFLNNLSFRQQVSELKANLRYVRLKAITIGKDIDFTLGDESRIIRLRGGLEKEKIMDIDNETVIVLEPEEIVFSPQGYVTPATLKISLEERSRTIIMDPLTALPVEE